MLLDTGANISVASKRLFKSLLQISLFLKVYTHKVTSASGTNLHLIGQCDLTSRLGNKQFADRFIVLQDLQRNLILGLNWQYNYRIGCNWNVSGQWYIAHNNFYALAQHCQLPPKSISQLSVQAPTELNTKHIYQPIATDDLLSGIIPLAVAHKKILIR